MIQNYLTNNGHRFASKWLVLAIDLITLVFPLFYHI